MGSWGPNFGKRVPVEWVSGIAPGRYLRTGRVKWDGYLWGMGQSVDYSCCYYDAILHRLH